MQPEQPTETETRGNGDSEKWYCKDCEEFRYVDGDEGYCCDAPRDCPSDAFDEQNCGYVVCGTCHTPLSDDHLTTAGDML